MVFSKLKLYLFLAGSAVAAILFLVLKADRDSLKAELATTKQSLVETEVFLTVAKQESKHLRESYESVNLKLAESNAKLAYANQEYETRVKVFEEENGRFKLLFQRRASLLVALANNATDRLWLDLETKTKDNGSGRKSVMSEYSTPPPTEVEFD